MGHDRLLEWLDLAPEVIANRMARLLAERVVRITVEPFMDMSTMIEGAPHPVLCPRRLPGAGPAAYDPLRLCIFATVSLLGWLANAAGPLSSP